MINRVFQGPFVARSFSKSLGPAAIGLDNVFLRMMNESVAEREKKQHARAEIRCRPLNFIFSSNIKVAQRALDLLFTMVIADISKMRIEGASLGGIEGFPSYIWR